MVSRLVGGVRTGRCADLGERALWDASARDWPAAWGADRRRKDVGTVLALAARREDLTEEQLALQRAWRTGHRRRASGYNIDMEVATSTEVGIRDLKNGLSKYLERVRAGEEVIVTDRGRPVARLSAIDARTDRLADLVAAGVVRAPTRKARRRPSRRIEAKGSVSDLVSEQRR